MPITHTVGVMAFAATVAVPLAVLAQSDLVPQTSPRQIISRLDQLEDFKEVKENKEMYLGLSGANVVFAKCAKEYDIAEREDAYLKQKFSTVTKNYIKAYQDAYVMSTSSPPPQSFVNDVVAKLTESQQKAVDAVALVLRDRKGCMDGRLKPFVKYVDRLRRQDKELAEQKPAPAAVPYQ